MLIRSATQGDVDAILALQRECYAQELVESEAVFRSIVAFGMSWVAEVSRGGIIGYALVHPAAHGSDEVPALHAPMHPMHDAQAGDVAGDVAGKVYFVHDLTVRKAARHTGVGTALAQHVVSHPQAVSTFTLVAVNGAEPFWERCGFRARSDVTVPDGVRASYGGGPCTFMTLTVAAKQHLTGSPSTRRVG